MIVKNIYLKNFRNYSEEKFDFSSNINILYGKNGQGKTNVIEALYYFCQGKSYRGCKDKEVIKFNEEKSLLTIEFESNLRDIQAEIKMDESKIVSVNGINIKRLSELVGYLKAVIFTPDHLNIIKSGPSQRRNFLDSFLSSVYPVYFKYLINYYKVLKQKNILLKTRSSNDALISVWNEKLSEYGVIISKYREDIIKKINPYIKKYQKEISDEKEDLYLEYICNIKDMKEDKEKLFKYLEENKIREKEAGISLIGPHRDDFNFIINEKNAKLYSSQGQQRTAVLSLKLSEADIIYDIVNEYPILLLDDITSELDEKRIEYLTSKIRDKQVIITCTKKEKNLENNENTKIFKIKEGKIVREE